MKPTTEERVDLARRVAEARSALALSDADLGRLTGVHPSQVGRICRGEFRTISNNVMQICKALGLTAQSIQPVATPADNARSKLEKSMMRAWDHTSEGAEKLAKVLDAIAEVRTS